MHKVGRRIKHWKKRRRWPNKYKQIQKIKRRTEKRKIAHKIDIKIHGKGGNKMQMKFILRFALKISLTLCHTFDVLNANIQIRLAIL